MSYLLYMGSCHQNHQLSTALPTFSKNAFEPTSKKEEVFNSVGIFQKHPFSLKRLLMTLLIVFHSYLTVFFK